MAENLYFFGRVVSLWRLPVLMVLVVCLQYCYNASKFITSDYFAKINSSSNHTRVEKRFNYHRRIMSFERFMAMNSGFQDLGKPERVLYSIKTPVCRIDMSSLGPRVINKTALDLGWVEKQLPQVLPGGYYAPRHCRSRHRVAILIPYRDRSVNLAIFLYYMHPLWQKQLLQYRVFVIEQHGDIKFNKGTLFNIGFLEAHRFGSWDCLYFHDVDLIPMDERVLYTCPRKPTHVSGAVESSNFKLQYETLFGGVTVMTPWQFFKVNGYSNNFWDWGGEDDDMSIRLKSSRLPLRRLNLSIARFTTLPHKPQKINANRFKILKRPRRNNQTEGISTLEYKLISITKRKLYTEVLVE